MSTPNVYDFFIKEMDNLTIKADAQAVTVVGTLTRAVMRAQNKWDEKYGCGHCGHMMVEGVRQGMTDYGMEKCDDQDGYGTDNVPGGWGSE